MSGQPLENVPPRGAAPIFGFLATIAPFFGFMCGVCAGMSAPHFRWFEWGFRVWFPFGVLGLIFAAIALARRERWYGFAVVGGVLSLILVVFLLANTDEWWPWHFGEN